MFSELIGVTVTKINNWEATKRGTNQLLNRSCVSQEAWDHLLSATSIVRGKFL